MKGRCETCKYNKLAYGERFWNCIHPIPCEKRLISEDGCDEYEKYED